MAQTNADEVVVGASGTVYVATYANVSAWPSDVTTALPGAFKAVGFTSEDGINFTDGKTIEDIKAWQSAYPIRKLVTERTNAIEFALRQWNATALMLAFGGGTISYASSILKYLPPAFDGLSVLAMVVEWADGTDTFRLVIPRGHVTGEVSTNVVRTSSADLPIHFEAVPLKAPTAGQDSTQPWYLLTNAFNATT